MSSDTTHPEDLRDLENGAAFVPPVTDAMMDHAAHEAAAMADGVAHGTVAPGQDAAAAAEATTDAVEQAAEAARDTVAEAGEALNQVSDSAVQLAGSLAEEAERGADAARESLSASADALGEYNAKVLEMMRTNLASTTALFAALVQAKSVPEALSLNAEHLRRQMETLTSQGRDLAVLAQRVALDTLQPLKVSAGR